MFKNKWFLSGLGAGLILGAILLQLMNAASAADNKPFPSDSGTNVNQDVTEDDLLAITQRAAQLGYQLFPKDEVIYTAKQHNDLLKSTIDEVLVGANERNVSEVITQKRALSIVNGTSSSQVGEMLLELGLITDYEAFNRELKTRKLSSRVQAGTYSFEGEPELSAIIELITKQ